MPDTTQGIGFPLSLKLRNIKHLQLQLKYSIESLNHLVNKKNQLVKKLVIKTNDKERIVFNPNPEFKSLLKTINKKLLQKAELPDGVVGGVIGKTIENMVECHCGNEAVFALDLKNFFPSIKSGMIFKFFQRAECSNEIAGLLTNLITLDDSLPQGFPTSPMLANLIAFDLDVKHLSIAKKYNLKRTRWIDDIIFSGTIKNVKSATAELIGLIKHSGFIINKKKTRFIPRKQKPVIVGLDVKRHKPHIPELQILELERLLDKCITDGPAIVQSTYSPNGDGKIKDLQQSLAGKLRYIKRFDPDITAKFEQKFKTIEWKHDEWLIAIETDKMSHHQNQSGATQPNI